MTGAYGESQDPGSRLLQPLVKSCGRDGSDSGDEERDNNDDGVDMNLMGLGCSGWEHDCHESEPQRQSGHLGDGLVSEEATEGEEEPPQVRRDADVYH